MEECTNVIVSEVDVCGCKRISFEDKNKKLIEGVKVFYTHPIKENEYNKHDICGDEIDPNDYSCFIKDIERYDEFNQITPYKAMLKQEFVATNKPLKFVDIILL